MPFFRRLRFYAPLLDGPVEFDLAYGCGNAYLFDYGDRHLAAKGLQWRNGKPTEDQRNLFQRLRDKVKDISAGSISFAAPGEKKGEYGVAIAALNAEMVLFSGRKIESEAAKQFIKQNLHSRIGGEEPIPISLNGKGDPAIEVALKRAIAVFSKSEEGGFLDYLKRILLENEIVLDGDCLKISHANFPRRMTEKQLDAARDRIQKEIRLYAPDAEVVFIQFRVLQKEEEKIKNSSVDNSLVVSPRD